MESRFTAVGEFSPVQEFDADGRLPLRTTAVKTCFAIVLACVLPLLAIPWITDRALQMVMGVILGTIAVIMLFVTLIVRATFGRYRKTLDKMPAGEHLAYWKVDEATWHKFIEHERRSASAMPKWVALGVGIFGLVTVSIIIFSQKSPFGTDSLLWIFGVTAGVAAIGWLVGQGIAWFMRCRCEYLARHAGIVLISNEGVYLTGEYRPYKAIGQAFEGVSVRTKPDDLTLLVFAFQVQTNDGHARQEMRVPVPAGHGEKANEIVRMFGGS